MRYRGCRYSYVIRTLVLLLLLLVWWIDDDGHHHVVVEACTDILVTPGASVDGSAMVAYNADSPVLMGMLYHYPEREAIIEGEEKERARPIYDWDSGKYLGTIMEDVTVPYYNVVGNSNQYGLVIGETTFGGVSVLAWNQRNGIIDYGSLIYLTLQRCQTVACAIQTMTSLMDTYGYVSGGESFSLADRITGEVWMMEVISRGNDYGKLGAVWVAQRIPDGMLAAHANHARITTFPRDDPANCLYADDVVDVAVHYGLYPAHSDPLQFSFSDVYDPLSFMDARQGEARVWSIFSQIADTDGTFQKQYEQYALGYDIAITKRMPLYVKPYKKLSLQDIGDLMSSHYENTSIDPTVDVGGGLFGSPYRPRPLQWTYGDNTYFNERTVAIEKSGWTMIGQIRMNMPYELSAILWFACDDSSTSPRVPIYSSSTRLPEAYYLGGGPQDGVKQPLLQFDINRAFWIQNMVSNFAYSRWNDVYPVLRQKIKSIQDGFEDNIKIVDERALTLYHNSSNRQEAINYVTLYSVNAGNTLQKIWMNFYGELFVKFRDYYTIIPSNNDLGCEAIEPGLSNAIKKRIVDETGDHYRVIKKQNINNPSMTVHGGENGPPRIENVVTDPATEETSPMIRRNA